MPLSDIWTIQNLTAGTPPSTFSALGLEGLKITYTRQSIHVARFTQKGATLDSAYLFNFNDRCAIFRNSAPWFVGTITKPSSGGDGATGEQVDYELSNDWWLLAVRIVFQQLWFIGNQLYPRVILGQEILSFETGEYQKMTTDQVINEVMDYAITVARGMFQIGRITPGPLVPYSERVNIMCAEAIKMMLKWMGSAVDQWDYTTKLEGALSPTLNILARSECTPQYINITDKRVIGIPRIAPLPNLQVPIVGIWYEQKNTDSDATATTYTLDPGFPRLASQINVMQIR